MRALVSELKAPLADVSQAFRSPEAEKYFNDIEVDYIHTNDAGQAAMAVKVYETMEQAGFLIPP